MIQKTELRIGNIITDKWAVKVSEEQSTPLKWFAITGFARQHPLEIRYGKLACNLEDAVPVEFSGEWAKRFGFTHFPGSNIPDLYRISIDNQRQLRFDGIDGISIETKMSGWIYQLPHIRHVHRVQNLFFELANHELNIVKQ